MTPEELLPHARALARSDRRWKLGLGGLLLGLGAFGSAIVALAATGTERIALLVIFSVVAELPGALLFVWGRKPVDRHPLVEALLTSPDRIADIRPGYLETLTGHERIATVTLRDGTLWNVEVP